MSNDVGTPMSPNDCFRGIGFDTNMWPDKMEETVFFWIGEGESYTRFEQVSEAAVKEFVEYYENQIAVAKEYLANGRNPNTHEWVKK